MLEKLFNSKTRAKLLKFFIHHPEAKFESTQIAKKLRLTAASAKKELDNLLSLGIIVKTENDNFIAADEENIQNQGTRQQGMPDKKITPKKEGTFYAVNRDFVLYEELKALIIKSQLLYEKDFFENIKALGRIKLLVLTGGFVSCDQSPIDIFIVGNLNKSKFQELVNEIEADFGREINYTIMNHNEFKYRRDMTDVFLYNILEGKKMIIIDEIDIFS